MSRTRRSRAAAEQVDHGGAVAASGVNRAALFNRIVNQLPIIEYAADSLATLLPVAHINTAFHDATLHHCPANFWRRIALTMKPRGSSRKKRGSANAKVNEHNAPLRLLWNLAHHDRGDAFEAVLARSTPSETRLMFTTMRAAGFKLKNKVLESEWT